MEFLINRSLSSQRQRPRARSQLGIRGHAKAVRNNDKTSSVYIIALTEADQLCVMLPSKLQ